VTILQILLILSIIVLSVFWAIYTIKSKIGIQKTQCIFLEGMLSLNTGVINDKYFYLGIDGATQNLKRMKDRLTSAASLIDKSDVAKVI
jgi:uncharacterized membrane protein